MISRLGIFISSAFLLSVVLRLSAEAETNVRDSTVYIVARQVSNNQFSSALDAVNSLIKGEPDNPAAHFLRGAVYQTISEAYRNDDFKSIVYEDLGRAIDLSNGRKKKEPNNPDWYFLAGAAYGYRGLHRALHGDWWQAFRDGLRCNSNLRKTLEIDSTYYDAYFGLGAYHYYRTVMAGAFTWLPFVSDLRDQGKAEIGKAVSHGYIASGAARESLLGIYLLENNLDGLISMADSITSLVPGDVFALLCLTEGLLARGNLDQAEEKLRRLKSAWKESPYYDPVGMLESELLLAKIEYRRGNTELAGRILDHIISCREMCDRNAYFAETYEKAKRFSELHR
jgi:tetratricopeptide (TPR) repeat protein